MSFDWSKFWSRNFLLEHSSIIKDDAIISFTIKDDAIISRHNDTNITKNTVIIKGKTPEQWYNKYMYAIF